MNILVLYDSQFGCTEKIAKDIVRGFGSQHTVTLYALKEMSLKKLPKVELFVVGSPTQGGRATQDLEAFLNTIPDGSLNKVRVAAFDTRFNEKKLNVALRLLMKMIGYAAPKILGLLKSKGGIEAIAAEGFYVTGKEGPIADGEEVRAEEWAGKIVSGTSK